MRTFESTVAVSFGSVCRDLSSTLMVGLRLTRYSVAVMAYATLTGANVQAQTTINFDPPDLKLVDNAGINLISGRLQVRTSPVSIGPKDSGLTFSLDFNGDATRLDNPDGFWGEVAYADVWEAYQSTSRNIEVRFFNDSDFFRDGSTTNRLHTGSTISLKADGSYEYVRRDGVRYITDPAVKGRAMQSSLNQAIAKVIYPNGYEIDIKRVLLPGAAIPVVQSVTTNYGYQLRYTYDASNVLTKVTAVNLAVDYCDPTNANCTYSRTWPAATFLLQSSVVNFVGPTTLTITDSASRVSKYFSEDGNSYSHYTRFTSVQWPSSSSVENVVLKYAPIYTCVTDYNGSSGAWYCSSLRDSVKSVDIGDNHWDYSYTQESMDAPYQAGLDGIWTTKATSPAGLVTSAHYDVRRNTVQWVLADNGPSQNFGAYNRVATAADAEGRNFSFTYDDRGNVLTKTQTSTSGSAGLLLQANYDLVCNNAVSCNKPNWVTDAKGNQTDYTYDPIHGGVRTETLPADANGVRPQKRYTYVQRTAMIKNSAGGYSAAGAQIWMLDTMSYCRTSSAMTTGCQAANDEVVTKYEYGPTAGANNLMLRGTVITADGVSHRSCYTYDDTGNKISETTANAGLTSCN